jgi:integrase
MTSEKKFFAKLYPADRDMTRTWFIKFFVRDYKAGELKSKKYKGYLNLIADKDARMAEAARLLRCIEEDKPLPDVKGARRLPAPDVPKNFADIILLCKKYLENIRYRIDHSTYIHYKSRNKVFHHWLSLSGRNNLPVGAFTVQMAKEFLRWLKETGYSNMSHNDYRSGFGRLWKEMQADGIVLSNPWRETQALPRMSIPFRAMTENVEKTVMENLPVFDAQLWIAVQFVYYDFIRITELRRLKLWMIDWHSHTITLPADVSRKGKRERTVVIPDVLFNQLTGLRYHELEPEYFIFSVDGVPGAEQLSQNNLSNRFRKFREHFNIPVFYKLYGMKHTGNTKLARMGVNAQLQRLHNGHTSLEYTQRYLSGLSIADIEFLKTDFPQIGS